MRKYCNALWSHRPDAPGAYGLGWVTVTMMAASLAWGQTLAPRRALAPAPKAAILAPAAVGVAELWRQPHDIAGLDLAGGPAGAAHAPQGPMAFVQEDPGGSNPKFVVRDAAGTKWKVKLGVEARSETVAARLLWAMGYYAREDYFVPEIQVSGVHLQRGAKLIGPGGTVTYARLEREPDDEQKIGTWKWKDNPLLGTRAFNGLRVMMALINNWDLKDDNNAVYRVQGGPDGEIYMVGDVGASFGATHIMVPPDRGKSNVRDYSRSSARFVKDATPEYVDFDAPGRPSWVFLFAPIAYISRSRMQWIGHRVPRADVAWIAGMLAQLTPEQIRDAFAAAGYTPEAVEGFAQALQERIGELKNLRE